MEKTRTFKKAWIIKWSSFRSLADNKVIAILNSRISSERIQKTVQQLYISFKYSPLDMINHFNDPPPILFAESKNGFRWLYSFSCGEDDPFLDARLVRNLYVVLADDGSEKVRWEEIPRPSFSIH